MTSETNQTIDTDIHLTEQDLEPISEESLQRLKRRYPIQFNELLNIKKIGRKPTDDELRAANRSQFWTYQAQTTTEIIQRITTGGTHRWGIKRESNNQKDFEAACGCSLDFDSYHPDLLAKTLTNPLNEQSFIGYPSPSYDPDHRSDKYPHGIHKHRISFVYSKPIIGDIKLAKKVVLTLASLYRPELLDIWAKGGETEGTDFDRRTFNPGNIFFGMSQAGYEPFYTNPEAVLDLDWLISVIPQVVHDKVDREFEGGSSESGEYDDDNSGTINRQFCDHLRENFPGFEDDPSLFLEQLIDKLNAPYRAHLRWHPSPGDNIREWRGQDPIVGGDTSRPNSFYLAEAQNGTFIIGSGKTGESADILGFVYHLKTKSWKKVDEDLAPRHKKKWAKEICKMFDLPEFRFEVKRDESEFYFPKVGKEYQAAYITEPVNFRLAFDCDITDMKYDRSRDQFCQWSEDDQHWKYIEETGELEAKLMLAFKSYLVIVKVKSKDDPDEIEEIPTYPMAFNKYVVEAIGAMKKELGVNAMIPPFAGLALKNGFLKLDRGDWELIPHCRELNITEVSQVEYNSDDRPENNEYVPKLLEIIPDDRQREVFLISIGAALDIKGYYTLTYLRAIWLIGISGRNGKDVLKLAVTQPHPKNKLSTISLSDYDKSDEQPNRVYKAHKADIIWSSETTQLGGLKLDNLKDYKADITGEARQVKRLHHDPFEAKTNAMIVQNMNMDAKFDTGKASIFGRIVAIDTPLYYAPPEQYNPNNPNHRRQIPEFGKEWFALQNYASAFLNLRLEYYRRIWKEGLRPDYSYMNEYVQQRLEDRSHIYSFISEVGIEESQGSIIPLSYLRHVYYAWCIAREKMDRKTNIIEGKDKKPLSPDDLIDAIDFQKVLKVVYEKIEIDRRDSDPIATNDLHFRKKLEQAFPGCLKFDKEVSNPEKAKYTKPNRSLIVGLKLPWHFEKWTE